MVRWSGHPAIEVSLGWPFGRVPEAHAEQLGKRNLDGPVLGEALQRPFLALPRKDHQIAVARYVTNPDGHSCEFAIVVADDWHNKGIATELLRRLIDIARDRRLGEMVGIVLRENKGMIALAKELRAEGYAVWQN